MCPTQVVPGKYEERFNPLCFSSRKEALSLPRPYKMVMPQKAEEHLLMGSGGGITSVANIYYIWSRGWQNCNKRN